MNLVGGLEFFCVCLEFTQRGTKRNLLSKKEAGIDAHTAFA